MRLSKDDILKAPGPAIEIVPVPEWGGEVAVRGMTGTERDAFESASMRAGPGGEMVPDAVNIRARMAVCCMVDEETGERLFTDADAADLGCKSAQAITRVATVAAKLSGLAEADVEELAENFGGRTKADTEPGGGSSSASSGTSARSRSKGSSPR